MEGKTCVQEGNTSRGEKDLTIMLTIICFMSSLTDLPNESVKLDVDMARQAQLADTSISECHIKTLAYACRKCKSEVK